jgi:uncharacterized protein
MKISLPEDHFIIPMSEGFLLYVPLKGMLYLLSQRDLRTLAHALTAEASEGLDHSLSEILDELSKSQHHKTSATAPPDISPWSHLTLDLSSRCTLACVYCYAGQTGQDGVDMSLDCAKDAIDLCIRNTECAPFDAEHPRRFSLIFHGGSEPTTNWNLFVQVIGYAREECEKRGVKCSISMSSNGFYSARRASWITNNVNNVSLSLDGFKAIQDSHRPTLKGKSSFEQVLRSADIFYSSRSQGFSFGLRPTVTSYSVDVLPEIVAFFADRFPGIGIATEPVEEVGNCKASTYVTPEPHQFAAKFIEARMRYPQAELTYSGFNGLGNLRQRFCSASEPQMAVLPSGVVTACYGYSLKDTGLDEFVFGHYDHGRGQFVFDEGRKEWLRNLDVRNVGACKDCFAKYHCGGDCPVLRLAEERNGVLLSHRKRCVINREITKPAEPEPNRLK